MLNIEMFQRMIGSIKFKWESQFAFCRICECGWSRNDHNEEARRNGPDTNPLPTDAFERLVSSEGFINYRPDYGYVCNALELQFILNAAALFTGDIPKLRHIKTFTQ